METITNEDDEKHRLETRAAFSAGENVSSLESLPPWLDEKIPTPAVRALIWLNIAVFLAMVNSVLYWNGHLAPGSPSTHESLLFSHRGPFLLGERTQRGARSLIVNIGVSLRTRFCMPAFFI